MASDDKINFEVVLTAKAGAAQKVISELEERLRKLDSKISNLKSEQSKDFDYRRESELYSAEKEKESVEKELGAVNDELLDFIRALTKMRHELNKTKEIAEKKASRKSHDARVAERIQATAKSQRSKQIHQKAMVGLKTNSQVEVANVKHGNKMEEIDSSYQAKMALVFDKFFASLELLQEKMKLVGEQVKLQEAKNEGKRDVEDARIERERIKAEASKARTDYYKENLEFKKKGGIRSNIGSIISTIVGSAAVNQGIDMYSLAQMRPGGNNYQTRLNKATAKGALGGAVAGASIGAFGGPLGAALGAAAGAIVGGFMNRMQMELEQKLAVGEYRVALKRTDVMADVGAGQSIQSSMFQNYISKLPLTQAFMKSSERLNQIKYGSDTPLSSIQEEEQKEKARKRYNNLNDFDRERLVARMLNGGESSSINELKGVIAGMNDQKDIESDSFKKLNELLQTRIGQRSQLESSMANMSIIPQLKWSDASSMTDQYQKMGLYASRAGMYTKTSYLYNKDIYEEDGLGVKLKEEDTNKKIKPEMSKVEAQKFVKDRVESKKAQYEKLHKVSFKDLPLEKRLKLIDQFHDEAFKERDEENARRRKANEEANKDMGVIKEAKEYRAMQDKEVPTGIDFQAWNKPMVEDIKRIRELMQKFADRGDRNVTGEQQVKVAVNNMGLSGANQ